MPLREIFKATEPSDVDAAERRLALAQALQQRSMRGTAPAPGGAVQARYTPGNALADLANTLASAYGVKKAEDAYGRAKTAKEAASVRALQSMIGGRQVAPPQDGVGPMPAGGVTATPSFEQSLPMAQNALTAGANPQLVAALLEQRKPQQKKYERVDLGNEIGIMDERGQIVQRLPKGVSPDASLGSQTTQRGQDLTAGTTQRGQDIIMRGQDMSSETTRRGQDMTAATAQRGQDLTTPKGVKPTEYDKKASLLYNEMVDSEKQLRAASGADTSSKYNAALNTNPLTRVFTSDDYRQHEAAGTRWAQNFLYLKSGASAPAEEVRKTFIQYLPQPGDGPDVIEQKKTAREQAMANVAAANGQPAADWDAQQQNPAAANPAIDALMQRFLQSPPGAR